MKISRQQVIDNRQRVLQAAARLFREQGFDAVTVADVMNAAGLTHGAFYGHFDSKADLIAQAVALVMKPAPDEPTLADDILTYADRYLTSAHRDHPGDSCVFSTLGTEVCRASEQARHTLTDQVRSRLQAFTMNAPGATDDERRQAAVGSWAAMIGALMLARIVDDPALSDQLLADTKGWLDARLK